MRKWIQFIYYEILCMEELNVSKTKTIMEAHHFMNFSKYFETFWKIFCNRRGRGWHSVYIIQRCKHQMFNLIFEYNCECFYVRNSLWLNIIWNRNCISSLFRITFYINFGYIYYYMILWLLFYIKSIKEGDILYKGEYNHIQYLRFTWVRYQMIDFKYFKVLYLIVYVVVLICLLVAT